MTQTGLVGNELLEINLVCFAQRAGSLMPDSNFSRSSFGYLNFGHWDLFEICNLLFVIYNDSGPHAFGFSLA